VSVKQTLINEEDEETPKEGGMPIMKAGSSDKFKALK